MLTKTLNKKQIAVVSLASLLLVCGAVGLDVLIKKQPKGEGSPETATVSSATSSSAGRRYSAPSSKLTEIVEDEPYRPGPDVLNLAYYYPEGADTSDVIHSYAGEIYTRLTMKEASYMAELYDMSDRSPLSMAKELGLPTSRVLGKYNPGNASHDPNNPASWTIDNFKNANIAFYDGDGNRINAYSTVKEVLSMASVYSYYHDMFDADAVSAYAEELWSHSHSYKISMGNVYYCSGCLNKTIQEEALEAIEQEKQQQLLEQSLMQRTALSAGDQMLDQATLAAISAPEDTESAASEGEQDEATMFFQIDGVMPSVSGASDPESAFGELSASEPGDLISSSETQQETLPEASSEQSASSPGENGSSASFLQDSTAVSAAALPESSTEPALAETTETIPSEASSTEAVSFEETEASALPSETVVQATGASELSGPTLAGFSLSGEPGAVLSYRGTAIAAVPEQEATFFGGAPETAAESTAASEAQTSAVPDVIYSGTSANEIGPGVSEAETAEAGTAESRNTPKLVSSCPGHIDLYITVTIHGIDDSNGLLKYDSIGNSEANFNEGWKGWTPEAKASLTKLNAEDWFKRYGLTISAINITNPLTEGEIENYLSRISDTVSQTRRDIVDYALHSVGKIPYYWGGKPSGTGYEKNRFGTIVAPDTKGRVLRGLDCSGWINWVYWSVLGERLPGESTGTLIGCGQRISRAELQPGDIIVRTGADAHVVMFLEWAGNGNMIAIHETGGAVNNVTVSEMAANWPYYRKLVE